MSMIVSSRIIEDAKQVDGRRWITERHTRDDGTFVDVTYMAGPKDDVSDMLLIRAAQITAADMAALDAPPPEKYYSKTEVFAAVEKVFGKDSSKQLEPELAADITQAVEIK